MGFPVPWESHSHAHLYFAHVKNLPNFSRQRVSPLPTRLCVCRRDRGAPLLIAGVMMHFRYSRKNEVVFVWSGADHAPFILGQAKPFQLFCTVQLEWFKSLAAGIDGVDLSGSLSQPVIWFF